MLLYLMSCHGAAHCTNNHSHIVAGPATNQTPQTKACNPANHGTDSGVMIAMDLNFGNLLNSAATDFGCAHLCTDRGTGKQYADQ